MHARILTLCPVFSLLFFIACTQPLPEPINVEQESVVNEDELEHEAEVADAGVEEDAGLLEGDAQATDEAEDEEDLEDSGDEAEQSDEDEQRDDADEGEVDEEPVAETHIDLMGFVLNSRGAIADADVICSCGEQTRSDTEGQWGLRVPLGTHTLTFSRNDHEVLNLEIDTSDGDASWSQVFMQPFLVELVDHEYLIRHLGGDVVEPFAYEETLTGFQEFLDDTGIVFFSAREISTPHNQSAATNCGYVNLLPPRSSWHKMAALGLFADDLRSLVGESVAMRNWWRPPCYNSAVGGAAGGDHPDADAIDLDFRSGSSRGAAQGYLCSNYWSRDLVSAEESANGRGIRLNMSVGVGGNTIHLGVLSSRGRRSWRYGSYYNVSGDGNCF